jgi:hypothetical protein
VNNHPLVIILSQMHIVDTPCCNQFGAGGVVKYIVEGDLFRGVWWELAVLVVGFGMFNEGGEWLACRKAGIFVSDLRTRFSVMGGFWSSGNNIIEAQ